MIVYTSYSTRLRGIDEINKNNESLKFLSRKVFSKAVSSYTACREIFHRKATPLVVLAVLDFFMGLAWILTVIGYFVLNIF